MKVKRRRPKPWDLMGIVPKGAPRTLLAGDPQTGEDAQYVRLHRGGSLFNVGTIDYRLRLYQHASSSGFKHLLYTAQEMTCVSYGLQNEWPVIQNCADWIEVADEEHKCVYRISVRKALLHGFRWETALGPRFLIPLMEYERVTR